MELTGDITTTCEKITREELVRIADLIGVPTEGRKVNDTTVFSSFPRLHFHVFPCKVRTNIMMIRVFYQSDLDLKKTAQIFEDVLNATGGRWLLVGKWNNWLSVSDIDSYFLP